MERNNTYPQKEILVAEYNSLREEILKRVQLKHYIMLFIITSFGGVMSFGVAYISDFCLNRIATFLFFLYPILCTSFTLLWVHHDRYVYKLGTYIRNRQVERSSGGWEKNLRDCKKTKNGRPQNVLYKIQVIATFFVFIFTDIIAFGMGIISHCNACKEPGENTPEIITTMFSWFKTPIHNDSFFYIKIVLFLISIVSLLIIFYLAVDSYFSRDTRLPPIIERFHVRLGNCLIRFETLMMGSKIESTPESPPEVIS